MFYAVLLLTVAGSALFAGEYRCVEDLRAIRPAPVEIEGIPDRSGTAHAAIGWRATFDGTESYVDASFTILNDVRSVAKMWNQRIEAERVQTATAEMLGNGFKHAHEEDPTKRFTLTYRPNEEGIHVSVRDSGPGRGAADQEELGGIFDHLPPKLPDDADQAAKDERERLVQEIVDAYLAKKTDPITGKERDTGGLGTDILRKYKKEGTLVFDAFNVVDPAQIDPTTGAPLIIGHQVDLFFPWQEVPISIDRTSAPSTRERVGAH